MIVVPGRFFLFFVSRQKEEWWSKKFSPRGCLSLSFFAPNEGSSARQKHRRRRSLCSLSRFRFDRGEKTTRRVFVLADFRARVFKFCRPMGNSPQKLCALSLSCTCFETERRTKNVAREYSRSLDGLATSAYLSRSRIRECKEREKRSKICAEIAFFFPLSFILQLSAHNFHRGLARAKRRRAARSFFSNPTHTGRR